MEDLGQGVVDVARTVLAGHIRAAPTGAAASKSPEVTDPFDVAESELAEAIERKDSKAQAAAIRAMVRMAKAEG